MLLDPEGKELFMELCGRLKNLKLIADRKPKKVKWEESIGFYFQREINEFANRKINQVATVHFAGDKYKVGENDVNGVILRLYCVPFQAFGLETILEKYAVIFCTKEEGRVDSPYFDFIFEEPYSCSNADINSIFNDLNEGFRNSKFGAVYERLEREILPKSIKGIPRKLRD
ncbi:hypothetical protein [Bacillus massiliigorillae]|uniref:hypothetical protein n=1 Tax=Bacillus massiliigorillae TaxID=1243664 RepID=UPI0003A7E027|nr:hypothetical protein [Bacillus massiliigorillae]